MNRYCLCVSGQTCRCEPIRNRHEREKELRLLAHNKVVEGKSDMVLLIDTLLGRLADEGYVDAAWAIRNVLDAEFPNV